MRLWLAVGEPFLVIRIPKVRFRNKEARLRVRAEAYVDKNFRSFYGASEEWRYRERKRMRVATMLSERQGVLNALDGKGRWGSVRVPRWRLLLRRKLTRYICERNRITKWW